MHHFIRIRVERRTVAIDKCLYLYTKSFQLKDESTRIVAGNSFGLLLLIVLHVLRCYSIAGMRVDIILDRLIGLNTRTERVKQFRKVCVVECREGEGLYVGF